ncbi:hypothetical protein C1645_842506 [Glomus cerebriforme]|uniref:Uncharacterized protein n=1 Tax=Glomus cerebriforme TaxID=658196 RepID=A0A397RZK4_9GLOM|nr:hypothetical protein C1645_842506 [Glomus cerebriforme]
MWDCISSIVRLELAFARVLSEHENDIKNYVKDILYDRNFYENSDAIYHMSNQNMQFKNHYIIKFNERFDEFSDDLFLLAFFLYPRYHGNGINPSKFHSITVKAVQIWKDMGYDQESCEKLLTQM